MDVTWPKKVSSPQTTAVSNTVSSKDVVKGSAALDEKEEVRKGSSTFARDLSGQFSKTGPHTVDQRALTNNDKLDSDVKPTSTVSDSGLVAVEDSGFDHERLLRHLTRRPHGSNSHIHNVDKIIFGDLESSTNRLTNWSKVNKLSSSNKNIHQTEQRENSVDKGKPKSNFTIPKGRRENKLGETFTKDSLEVELASSSEKIVLPHIVIAKSELSTRQPTFVVSGISDEGLGESNEEIGRLTLHGRHLSPDVSCENIVLSGSASEADGADSDISRDPSAISVKDAKKQSETGKNDLGEKYAKRKESLDANRPVSKQTLRADLETIKYLYEKVLTAQFTETNSENVSSTFTEEQTFSDISDKATPRENTVHDRASVVSNIDNTSVQDDLEHISYIYSKLLQQGLLLRDKEGVTVARDSTLASIHQQPVNKYECPPSRQSKPNIETVKNTNDTGKTSQALKDKDKERKQSALSKEDKVVRGPHNVETCAQSQKSIEDKSFQVFLNFDRRSELSSSKSEDRKEQAAQNKGVDYRPLIQERQSPGTESINDLSRRHHNRREKVEEKNNTDFRELTQSSHVNESQSSQSLRVRSTQKPYPENRKVNSESELKSSNSKEHAVNQKESLNISARNNIDPDQSFKSEHQDLNSYNLSPVSNHGVNSEPIDSKSYRSVERNAILPRDRDNNYRKINQGVAIKMDDAVTAEQSNSSDVRSQAKSQSREIPISSTDSGVYNEESNTGTPASKVSTTSVANLQGISNLDAQQNSSNRNKEVYSKDKTGLETGSDSAQTDGSKTGYKPVVANSRAASLTEASREKEKVINVTRPNQSANANNTGTSDKAVSTGQSLLVEPDERNSSQSSHGNITSSLSGKLTSSSGQNIGQSPGANDQLVAADPTTKENNDSRSGAMYSSPNRHTVYKPEKGNENYARQSLQDGGSLNKYRNPVPAITEPPAASRRLDGNETKNNHYPLSGSQSERTNRDHRSKRDNAYLNETNTVINQGSKSARQTQDVNARYDGDSSTEVKSRESGQQQQQVRVYPVRPTRRSEVTTRELFHGRDLSDIMSDLNPGPPQRKKSDSYILLNSHHSDRTGDNDVKGLSQSYGNINHIGGETGSAEESYVYDANGHPFVAQRYKTDTGQQRSRSLKPGDQLDNFEGGGVEKENKRRKRRKKTHSPIRETDEIQHRLSPELGRDNAVTPNHLRDLSAKRQIHQKMNTNQSRKGRANYKDPASSDEANEESYSDEMTSSEDEHLDGDDHDAAVQTDSRGRPQYVLRTRTGVSRQTTGMSSRDDTFDLRRDLTEFDVDAVYPGGDVYVFYLRTEEGDIVGPLRFDVEGIELGLPKVAKDNAASQATKNKDDVEGLRNRQTGSHGLNEFSSRSHSVLTVTVDSETQADAEDENLYVTKRGKLSFVDLAGSEKVKDASTQGGTGMTEANSINKSLLVLGNCIQHLGDSKRRQGHIPYRDSKLTKLLADSLAGNGITLMIACITPSSSNVTETLNTLRYASRAKKIKSKPTVKMDPREKLIVTLKKEIKILRNENHYLRQQLEFPAKPKGQLQKENDEKFMKFMKEQQQKESGLYEMLQEYMVENEALRAENSEMHSTKDVARRDTQILHKENEKLVKRVEELERLISEHPGTWTLLDVHRRTDGYGQHDLSPRGSPVNSAFQKPGRPMDIPGGGRTKVGSPPNTHGQPMRPPHRLQDHVTRPAPRPVDYVENGYHGNGYMSPRHGTVNNMKPGAPSPRQVDRRASQVSQTDMIRGINEQLKKEVMQLEGEIQQHARIAQNPSNAPKGYYR